LKRLALACLLLPFAAAPLFADETDAATAVSPAVEAVKSPVAAPAPASPQDSADALVRLQQRADDQDAAITRLQAAIEDLRTKGASTQDEAPSAWSRLSLHGGMDVRFDNQYNKNPQATGLGTGNNPNMVQPLLPSGSSGFFFKHMAIKFRYSIDDSTIAYLHYNLAALEIEKAGIEFRDLPIPPFTSGWNGWTYRLFVGQERQDFGIEQQTDSEDLYFPNRAMMFGGSTPFGNASTPTQDPFNFYKAPFLAVNNLIPNLVWERVMGLHFKQKHDFGFLAYDLGFDLVNDESENSNDGQGTDSLKSGFAFQLLDQDLSEIGRLGIDPRILNDHLPWGLNLKVGASAFHDPENTAYLTSQAIKENWADTYGYDGRLGTARDILTVQSEWVHRDQYGPGATGSGNTWTLQNNYGGVVGSAEGWYTTVAFQPLRIFNPQAPKVELLGRYDTFYYLNQSPWVLSALNGAAGYTGSYNATTMGIKYTYKGNCNTSIDFTTYGLNNDFTAAGPTQLIQLQQQVEF